MTPLTWQVCDRTLTLNRPLVMGILNVTPDSFSDGGIYNDRTTAVEHALRMVASGADIIDIGGESTRPYADPVPLDEELRRVIPTLSDLRARSDVLISIDTSKAEVAQQAVAAGAQIINDVTALLGDSAMVDVARSSGAGIILMHMQGTPQTMQDNPHYDDVVREVVQFLGDRIRDLEAAGIPRERMAIDPGIGFGKTNEHSLTLLANLGQLRELNRPLCLGVSRKGFIGKITGRERHERAAGSVAVACHAVALGHADIVRVHDVPETVDAMRVIHEIQQYRR